MDGEGAYHFYYVDEKAFCGPPELLPRVIHCNK